MNNNNNVQKIDINENEKKKIILKINIKKKKKKENKRFNNRRNKAYEKKNYFNKQININKFNSNFTIINSKRIIKKNYKFKLILKI